MSKKVEFKGHKYWLVKENDKLWLVAEDKDDPEFHWTPILGINNKGELEKVAYFGDELGLKKNKQQAIKTSKEIA